MQGADDWRMFGQTDRDGLIERGRQQFLDRLRRLQLLGLDADHPAKGGDGGVEIGLRDGVVGLAAGQRGFGLRDVGPGDFADLETVVTRKGAWVVPATFTAVAIMAGGEIDLRDARFAERVVTIHAVTIMGGIGIIVPDDAEVHVTGIGVMGAFEHGPTGTGQPGAPKIVINGLAFWGAVDVKRKPRKNKPKKTRKTLESGGEAAADSPG